MTATSPAQKLTDNLLSVIRQQRHLATRVLISTQEPTISPKLLDLCNVIVAHRFTSPEWLSFMKHHLAAVAVEADSSALGLLERIVALNEGEAYLFAPAGIVSAKDFDPAYNQDDEFNGGYGAEDGEDGEGSFEEEEEEEDEEDEQIRKLGLGYLKIKVRKRLTEDGGKSILANSAVAPVTARAAGVIPPEVAAAMVGDRGNSNRGRGGGGRGGRGGVQAGRWMGPPQQQQQQGGFNPPAQPRKPAQPQQNGSSSGQNNGWNDWGQSHQQQSQNSTWDPNQGANRTPNRNINGQMPKKDPAVKAMEKAARKAKRATTNGANGGGAPLPKRQ